RLLFHFVFSVFTESSLMTRAKWKELLRVGPHQCDGYFARVRRHGLPHSVAGAIAARTVILLALTALAALSTGQGCAAGNAKVPTDEQVLREDEYRQLLEDLVIPRLEFHEATFREVEFSTLPLI